jgi:hypothetical protein
LSVADYGRNGLLFYYGVRRAHPLAMDLPTYEFRVMLAAMNATPRRPGRVLPFVLVGFAGVLVGWAAKSVAGHFAGSVTTTALSPDDQWRAALVETQPRFIDRNFTVRVGAAAADPLSLEPVFESPDEGMPVGSERFIWSKDAEYLLLVGRHFVVEGSARLRTGEELYLLHHVPTKRQWCNARQTRAERFGFPDLARIAFVEPLVADDAQEKDRVPR